MNDAEVTKLLQIIQVLDSRKVDELVITVWGEVLKDVDYEHAVTAVMKHARVGTDYLTTRHVVQGAAIAKRERDHIRVRIAQKRWRELDGPTIEYWSPANDRRRFAELGRLIETNDPKADKEIRSAIEQALEDKAAIERGREYGKALTAGESWTTR